MNQAEEKNCHNILLAATGSVACVKIPNLIDEIMTSVPKGKKIDVHLITTENGLHFFDPSTISPSVKLYRDVDEWKTWSRLGDPVVHIELRRWADILVIAPLDANTLAKIACGMCDNLVTCVVRAWDVSKPLLFCPAMNTFMWDHPITATQVASLKAFGYKEVPPISKKLACGDTGMGAMATVEDIVKCIWKNLGIVNSS